MAANISSSNNASQRATTSATVYKVPEGLLLREVPPPPDELNEEGIRWWNYYCKLMVEGKVLSRMFITALTNLCIAHQARAIFITAIREDGMLIPKTTIDKEGYAHTIMITNPIWKDLEGLLVKMSGLLQDMGMTAWSAKVNNFDTKGALTQPSINKPPQITAAPPQKA